jgi:predicted Zn-dependent protease
MKSLFSFLLLLLITSGIHSQVDFDQYKTLQSIGAIPSDFSDQTSEKIEEAMSERRTEIGSELEQRQFLENTGYAIDELLHSGLVVYGDEVSNYVSSIADKLLKGNPDLRSKLRFYTLKLNATNAFSTDQGIIFTHGFQSNSEQLQ